MDLEFSQLASLDPGIARQLLPIWLGSYVAEDGAVRQRFVAAVEASLAATSDAELGDILAAFAVAGEAYQVYPAVPAARRLSRASMAELIGGSRLDGEHHLLAASATGPTLLLCNHLSYVDTTLTDLLLSRSAAAELVDRMVTIAGPKVYGSPFRRIAAVCLSTLKTAQSTALATNEVSLSAREVAAIALETVRQAAELMAAGRPVLLYGEGTRSRTGRLQPFPRAVSRYLAIPGVQIVPVAMSGSERVFPIDAEGMYAAPVQITIGAPIPGDAAAPRELLDEAWRALAALLPEAYRPA